jgi:hypothetical protein
MLPSCGVVVITAEVCDIVSGQKYSYEIEEKLRFTEHGLLEVLKVNIGEFVTVMGDDVPGHVYR